MFFKSKSDINELKQIQLKKKFVEELCDESTVLFSRGVSNNYYSRMYYFESPNYFYKTYAGDEIYDNEVAESFTNCLMTLPSHVKFQFVSKKTMRTNNDTDFHFEPLVEAADSFNEFLKDIFFNYSTIDNYFILSVKANSYENAIKDFENALLIIKETFEKIKCTNLKVLSINERLNVIGKEYNAALFENDNFNIDFSKYAFFEIKDAKSLRSLLEIYLAPFDLMIFTDFMKAFVKGGDEKICSATIIAIKKDKIENFTNYIEEKNLKFKKTVCKLNKIEYKNLDIIEPLTLNGSSIYKNCNNFLDDKDLQKFYHFVSPKTSDKNGICFGTNRYTSQPVIYDINKNPVNTFLIGQIGTPWCNMFTMTQDLISSNGNDKYVVVDTAGDRCIISQNVKGEIIDIDSLYDKRINILDLFVNDDIDKQLDIKSVLILEMIRAVDATVLGNHIVPEKDFNIYNSYYEKEDELKEIIKESLKEVYKNYLSEVKYGLSTEKCPTLLDFYNIISTKDINYDLKDSLEFICKESELFNKKTNIELDNKLTVIYCPGSLKEGIITSLCAFSFNYNLMLEKRDYCLKLFYTPFDDLFRTRAGNKVYIGFLNDASKHNTLVHTTINYAPSSEIIKCCQEGIILTTTISMLNELKECLNLSDADIFNLKNIDIVEGILYIDNKVIPISLTDFGRSKAIMKLYERSDYMINKKYRKLEEQYNQIENNN